MATRLQARRVRAIFDGVPRNLHQLTAFEDLLLETRAKLLNDRADPVRKNLALALRNRSFVYIQLKRFQEALQVRHDPSVDSHVLLANAPCSMLKMCNMRRAPCAV